MRFKSIKENNNGNVDKALALKKDGRSCSNGCKLDSGSGRKLGTCGLHIEWLMNGKEEKFSESRLY